MLEKILVMFPDEKILKADGLDNCIIGYEFKDKIRLIYSVKLIIEQLIREDGMDEIDAIEHFDYNIGGAYVGEQTPIYCHDDF